ncbi:glycosyltransferase [Demequina sp.]|uniref:glycosyltransferase n=1 Tax=Demequina sp. TaxID=2050685 RepID=UPI0025E823C0|nr:glycosyltransferase [Demequina sp.]
MPGFVEEDHRGVRLLHWTPDADITARADRIENFGDAVGPLIARRLAPDVDAPAAATLVTVGSVLHAAPAGATVWGAGVNAKLRRPLPPRAELLDVRAVRGPLTRAALIAAGAEVPETYGDPALLLPRVMPEVLDMGPARRQGVVVLPNLNELEAHLADPRVVSPLDDLWDIVRAILGAELVVGSSLHGIVFADALGVPARFVASEAEHPFKYADYLAGTGRLSTRIARSVDEAIEWGGHEAPEFDADALLAAFPSDLWTGQGRPAAPRLAGARALTAASNAATTAASGGALDRRLAESILSTSVLPGLARVSDRLPAETLSLVVSEAKALIDGGLEVSGFPWSNAAVAQAVLLDDQAALRRAALAAKSRDDLRVERMSLSPDLRTLVVDGLVTPRFGQPLHPSARVVATLEMTTRNAALEISGTFGAASPAARWTARLDVDALRALGKPVRLRVGEAHDDGERLTRPAVAPRLRAADLGPLRAAGIDVEITDSGELVLRAHPRSPAHVSIETEPNPTEWDLAEPTLLSVVIPVHNVADWLDDLLHSVLSQDVDAMEVIAVDDRSSDGSGEILARHAERDPRLRIIAPAASGGATARNIGAAAASGKYLIFADADDLVPRGAYRALVASLERSGSDIAFGDYLKFSNMKTWRPTTNFKAYNGTHEHVALASLPSLVRGRACWNKAFRRDFWQEHGIQFPEVPRSNDIQPMVRAYLAAKSVDVIGEVVYLYRQRPGASSMTSRASLGEGLVSYLRQELVCATLIDESGLAALRTEYTNLFVMADGWVHLARYADATLGTDERAPAAAVEALAGILRHLDPARMARSAHSKILPLRLFATGAVDAAQILMRPAASASVGDEAGVDVLDAWTTAVETLDGTDGVDRALIRAWESEIAPRVLHAAALTTSDRSRQVLARVSAALDAGLGNADRAKAPIIGRMREALALLGTEAGEAWLEARTVTGLVAESVERDGVRLELRGELPASAAGRHLTVAPYRAHRQDGPAVDVTIEDSRWRVTVPLTSIPRGDAARLRVQVPVDGGPTVDVPILVAGVTLPKSRRAEPADVLAAAGLSGPELEVKRHELFVTRARRAAVREAKAVAKKVLRR